jgi:hypothetical protein
VIAQAGMRLHVLCLVFWGVCNAGINRSTQVPFLLMNIFDYKHVLSCSYVGVAEFGDRAPQRQRG